MRLCKLSLPAMCEPELEEEVKDFTPAQRRELADKLQRWRAQLLASAELLERGGYSAELKQLPFNLSNSTGAECLELAAELESRAHLLRKSVGVFPASKPQESQFVWPN